MLLGACPPYCQSVAHRDIKPANIMIIDDDSYTVKIVDFGLAVDVDDEEDIPRLQSCCGTPAYIAPVSIPHLRPSANISHLPTT